MGIDIHTVEAVDGSQQSRTDRVLFWLQFAVANAAGGSAGAAVSTAVTFPATANIPANYFVDVEVSQDCTYYITSKTQAGFTVVMTPRLAANTLASGTFNVRVEA